MQYAPSLILDVKNVLGTRRNNTPNIITLHTTNSGGGAKLSCVGMIRVSYISGGVQQTDTYNDLVQTDVYFNADANTNITITGDVTEFITPVYSYYDDIDLRGCESLTALAIQNTAITDIDISENTQLVNAAIASNPLLANINVGVLPNLQAFEFSYQPAITAIDTGGLANLQQIHGDSTGISEIDLTNNLQLTFAQFAACANLITIRCRALDSNMANGIANTIQANAANAGTVYCNPNDPYYGVIAAAANNYGWTIQTL